jgi:maltooligosyltrehalose trehalohydrolase
VEHSQTPQPHRAGGALIARAADAGASEPFFGALPAGVHTTFRVWAPAAQSVTLHLEWSGQQATHEMRREGTGLFSATIDGVSAGALYRYAIDGGEPMPDPASRFQPFGVHGPSEVIDPAAYEWTDRHWSGLDPDRAVIYELHVGTFTPAGTFARAAERLPYLRDLGVTLVQLMPVADFAGERNWGYDGVNLFAPSRAYGRPEDLRAFVNAAHEAGLAVMLDVVYNHLGPDGAYLFAFAPTYFSSRHQSAWGQSINLDGPDSAMVRRFILDNARHWLAEYHMDGLRLDATHALTDESKRHIVEDIVETARHVSPRPVMVVAEDHRNDARMVREQDRGGWGLDGVWADDFHHIVRRILAGDHEGYYEDFRASVADLARTLQQGWFFTGQHSKHLGGPRGTNPAGIPLRKFIICLQNHDQIGNRAFGDRLHHAIDLAAYRAASALLLLSPETPLLFMGQEWAASTPFRYFTDHVPDLGEKIVKGRRHEFETFFHFRDPATRERIPSPQAPDTFESSRLAWSEREREPHAGIWRLYRRCLDLRSRWMGLPGAAAARDRARAEPSGDDAVVLRYQAANTGVIVVSRLRGAGPVTVPGLPPQASVILTTEDQSFAPDGQVPALPRPEVDFKVPATVVFAFTR